jgi:uncharacterized protein (TIGR00730 family)
LKVTVFCGARFGKQESFSKIATAVGAELAKRQIELVYGGSMSGTMGSVSAGALAHGGKVTGIYPQGLFEDELPRTEVNEFIETKNMADRKELLIELGDAFIVLPGGLGTLEELSQLLSAMNIGLIPNKKVGILNVDGYYNNFIKMLDTFVSAGFMDANYKDNLVIEADYHKLLSKLMINDTAAEMSA